MTIARDYAAIAIPMVVVRRYIPTFHVRRERRPHLERQRLPLIGRDSVVARTPASQDSFTWASGAEPDGIAAPPVAPRR